MLPAPTKTQSSVRDIPTVKARRQPNCFSGGANMSCFRSTFHASVRLLPATSKRCLSTVHDVPSASSLGSRVTPQISALQAAVNSSGPKTTWNKEQIGDIYNSPLIELQYAAVSPPNRLS